MYYQFTPTYLSDPTFKIKTTKLFNEHLYFLDRAPRLKMIKSFIQPTNVFFCRNINRDNFEFVVCPYRYDQGKSTDIRLYSPVSHDDDRDFIYNIQERTAFFSNLSANGQGLTTKPSFTNKGVYYMSFECVAHDALDEQAFLNEQLQWTFNVQGKDDACVLDKICKSLNKYNDFYGLFCCYDGNRNLQLHLEWDSRTLSPEKFPNPYVKDDKMVVYEPAEISLMFYWEVVAKMIQEVIEDERGIAVNFNTTLRNPLSVRRLPFGLKQVENLHEVFCVGDSVPQIELYSNTRHTMYEHLNSKGPLHMPLPKHRHFVNHT